MSYKLYSINELKPFHVRIVPIGVYYGFRILLTPLRNFKVDRDLVWCDDAYEIIFDNDTLLYPLTLYDQLFTPTSAVSYTFSREDSIGKSYQSHHVEISFKSLLKPKFCTKGFVTLASTNECPFESECSYYILLRGSCKRYMRYQDDYSKLYYPRYIFRYKFNSLKEIRGLHEKSGLAVRIYRGIGLSSLRGFSLVPRALNLFEIIELPFYLERPIGYIVNNAIGIKLEMDDVSLNDIIINILSDLDSTTLSLLKYKFYVFYNALKKKSEYFIEDYIDGEVVSILMSDLTKILNYEYFELPYVDIHDTFFIDFCKFVILHTFVHFFKYYLCKLFHIPSYKIHCAIHHTYSNCKENGIIVFADDLNVGRVIVSIKNDHIKKLISQIINHCHKMYPHVAKFCNDLTLCKGLLDRLRKKLKTYPHPRVLNCALTTLSFKLENFKTRHSSVLYCWDGCYKCIPNLSDCTFSETTCNVSLSLTLFYKFIEKIESII